MSSWSPLFALAIFPFSYFVAMNPVGLSWSFHHSLEPMPSELLTRAHRVDPYVVAARNVLIVVLLAMIIAHQSIPSAQLGLHINKWDGWPGRNAMDDVGCPVPRVMRAGGLTLLFSRSPRQSLNR
jgi:hypothetical protein